MLDPKSDFEILLIDEGKAQWVASADLDYFKGHFPNNPVLPAAAIVDVSIEILRRSLCAEEVFVKSIKSCKFMKPISPGTLIEIDFSEENLSEWTFDWKQFAQLTLKL